MKNKKLTDLQYNVLYKKATEPPFNNEYWNTKEKGIYVDRITGEPLFCSNDKYDSKTGWPSFTKPINKNAVKENTDISHGMERIELTTNNDLHLGHVFNDGPCETGLRYCMNSAALEFIPYNKMEEKGYKEYLNLFEIQTETAILAGGCFWGLEEYFSRINGVLNVKSGYTGGNIKNPTYDVVCSGKTNHAEAILIEFDHEIISYEKILLHFFRVHNPTTLNRQGPDTGTQYRSAVFWKNNKQKEDVFAVIKKLQSKYSNPIVTEIIEFTEFYDAEDYHQKYLKKNPSGYCHIDLSLAKKDI